jgi:hypothetical protein
VSDPAGSRLFLLSGTDNSVWSLDLAQLSWTRYLPAMPNPRGEASLAFDSQRNRLLLHGGGSGTQSGETWSFALGNPAWTSIVQVPPALFYHAAVFDPIGHRMLVFGGASDGILSGNETWTEDLGPNGEWAKLAPQGSLPSPRVASSAVFDPFHDRMVVFGGEGGDAVDLNDVWELSFQGPLHWNQLLPQGTAPQVRWGSLAVFDAADRAMILFGGTSAGPTAKYWNDAWELTLGDSPAWIELHPSGAPPPALLESSAIYDPVRNRVILFGGVTASGTSDTSWALSLGPQPAWSVIPVQGTPGARVGQGAVYDPTGDRMVVAEGIDDYASRDDAWALPLSGVPLWTRLNVPDPHPIVRVDATYVYDEISHALVLFGGFPPGQGINTITDSDAWALPLGDVPTPALPALVSADYDGSVVHLEWLVGGGASTAATVYRNADGAWAPIGSAQTAQDGNLIYEDRDVTAGQRYGYRLGVQTSQGEILGGETWVDTGAKATLSLSGAIQNPSRGRTVISFSLPDDAPASLALFDVLGRRMAAQSVHGAGAHLVDLNPSSSLKPGMYFVELTRGTALLVKKVCVLP